MTENTSDTLTRKQHLDFGFCDESSDQKDWCIKQAGHGDGLHMSLHYDREGGNYNVFWTDENKTPSREMPNLLPEEEETP